MQAALNAWCFPEDWDFRQACEFSATAGVKYIEVNLALEGVFSAQSHVKEWTKAYRVAEDFGLRIPSISTALLWEYPLTSPDAAIRQKGEDTVQSMLELASLVQADTVLVVPGLVTAQTSYLDAYQRAQESLHRLASKAGEFGVVIGIENVWNKFLLSPMECKRFIEGIGSTSLGMYLDIGNVLPNGYPEQWIDILGRHIRKVHVKDFQLSIGNISGFTSLFHGDIDWERVLRALASTGYDHVLTAEIPPKGVYPEELLLETVRSLGVLCRKFEELKTS